MFFPLSGWAALLLVGIGLSAFMCWNNVALWLAGLRAPLHRWLAGWSAFLIVYLGALAVVVTTSERELLLLALRVAGTAIIGIPFLLIGVVTAIDDVRINRRVVLVVGAVVAAAVACVWIPGVVWTGATQLTWVRPHVEVLWAQPGPLYLAVFGVTCLSSAGYFVWSILVSPNLEASERRALAATTLLCGVFGLTDLTFYLGWSHFPPVGTAVAFTVLALTMNQVLVHRFTGLHLHLEAEVEQRTVELADALGAAEAATRTKTAFMTAMSHELRTPINGIVGAAHLVPTSADDDYLATILGCANDLRALVDDILDYSLVEAGQVELVDGEVVLADALADICELFAPVAHARHLEMQLCVEESAQCVVRGDPARVRQVLRCLISNAVKFTDVGSVVVRAGIRDGRLRIGVRDTGCGIDPELVPVLFESFRQADGSFSRRHGGVGLGLTLADTLVTAMGGEIRVETAPGAGSTFTVELDVEVVASDPVPPSLAGRRILVASASPPFRDGAAAALQVAGAQVRECTDASALTGRAGDVDAVVIDTATIVAPPLASGRPELCVHGPLRPAGIVAAVVAAFTPQDAIPSGTASALPSARTSDVAGRPTTVLVVEDNPVNRKVLGRQLLQRGFDVDFAEHGGEAVAAYRPGVYACIFMDCQMPEMDGFEATRRIRHREDVDTLARTPIVAVTANASDEDRLNCIDAGMDDFCPKPLTPSALDAVLERWVGVVRVSS